LLVADTEIADVSANVVPLSELSTVKTAARTAETTPELPPTLPYHTKVVVSPLVVT
jgi:hypothetical protein